MFSEHMMIIKTSKIVKPCILDIKHATVAKNVKAAELINRTI